MKTSESIKNLAVALVKFHQEPIKIVKNAQILNRDKTVFSEYATLDNILTQITPPLTKHGLIVVQTVSDISVCTRLMHSSGEWIEDSGRIDIDDKNPRLSLAQAAGVAISYARRYSLAAILMLAIDDDNDGTTTPPDERQSQKPKDEASKNKKQNDDEKRKNGTVALIRKVMKSHLFTDEERLRFESNYENYDYDGLKKRCDQILVTVDKRRKAEAKMKKEEEKEAKEEAAAAKAAIESGLLTEEELQYREEKQNNG